MSRPKSTVIRRIPAGACAPSYTHCRASYLSILTGAERVGAPCRARTAAAVVVPGTIAPHSSAAAAPARSRSARAATAARTLEAERDAVAARVGAAHQRAVAQDDPVRVADLGEERGRGLDAVALRLERGQRVRGHARLDVERVGRVVG